MGKFEAQRDVLVAIHGSEVSLAYHEQYIGNVHEALPLIVCHGLGSSHRLLHKKFFPALASAMEAQDLNIRLLAFDWPGHGTSGTLPRYSLKLFTDVLRSFMDELELAYAHLYGMSLGATTIIRFAAQDPTRALTIAPQGTPLDYRDLPGHGEGATSYVRHILGLQYVRYLRQLFFVARDASIREIGFHELRRFRRAAFRDLMEDFFKLDLLGELASLASSSQICPRAFLIDGSHPEHIFIDTLKRLEAHLGHLVHGVCRVPGAGHMATISHPQYIAERYAQFLFESRDHVALVQQLHKANNDPPSVASG